MLTLTNASIFKDVLINFNFFGSFVIYPKLELTFISIRSLPVLSKRKHKNPCPPTPHDHKLGSW